MKKRLLSLMLALSLMAGLFISFGTVASAKNEFAYGWCGKSVKWLAVDDASYYDVTIWMKIQGQKTQIIFSRIYIDKNGKRDQTFERDGANHPNGVTYDDVNGVFTADFSNATFEYHNKYWINISYSDENGYLRRGNQVEGWQINDGYTQPLKAIEGSISIATDGKDLVPDSVLTAMPSIKGTTNSELVYTWERRDYNTESWVQNKNASGKTYTLTNDDIGYQIRVKVSDLIYNGYVASEPVRVSKLPNTTPVVAPVLDYKDGVLAVTNAQTNQQYVSSYKTLGKADLEEEFKSAFRPTESYLDLTQTANNRTMYVYTRVAEDKTTLAGTEIAMAYSYCGETTIGLSLKTLSASMTEDRDTGVYQAYQDEIMQLTASPTDSGNTSFKGVYGKDWKCTKSDGTAYSQFYADSGCKTPVDDNTQYKSVYVPLKNTGSQIAFSASSGGSTAIKLVSVGYAGYGGIIVPLESLTIPNVTVTKGTREYNLPAYPDPIDAYTSADLLSFQSKTEDGAPVVGLYSGGNLYVNAENASVGEYIFEVKYETQNGTQKSMCYFSVTVVENTQEAEALTLSANAILLAPGEVFDLSAIISPVGAKANVAWKAITQMWQGSTAAG